MSRPRGAAWLLPAGLVWAIALLTADSIVQAHWTDELPALHVVAALAATAALVLGRSRLPVLPAVLAALALGLLVVAGAALTLPSLAQHELGIDRVSALATRLGDWFGAAVHGQISTDTLPFGVVVGAVLWLATWIGGYAYARWREPWLLVMLPGAVLAVNVSYLGASFDWHFALFGVVAALLIADAHQRRVLARGHAGELSAAAQALPLLLVVLVSAGGVAGAHALPRLDRESEWAGSVGFVAEGVSGLQHDVSRLFGGATPPTVPDSLSLGASLPLVGFGGNGDRILARVQVLGAEEPIYLRAASYDRYDGRGWTVDPVETADLPQNAAPPTTGTIQVRVEVEAPTRTILLPDRPLALDLDARATRPQAASIEVALDGALPDELPADLRAALETAKALTRTSLALPADAGRLLPQRFSGAWLPEAPGEAPLLVVADRDPAPEVVELRSTETLQPGDRYIVQAARAAASAAPKPGVNAYPLWITRRYLNLPPGWADDARVGELQLELGLQALSPFEAAEALQAWLCCARLADGRLRFPDEPRSPAPPAGSDAVRWFLFERQDGLGRPVGGSATLRASAMTTLLRAAGVPARLAVGFRLDGDERVHALWAHDTLTWVEVYQPGAGWRPFDPTPGPDVPLYDLGAAGLGPNRLSDAGLQELLTELEPRVIAQPPPRVSRPPASRLPAPADAGKAPAWRLPLILAATLAVVAALPALVWRLSLRGRGEAERCWASVQRWAWLAGIPRPASMTALEFAALVGDRVGASAEAQRLAEDYAAARFGHRALLTRTDRREAYSVLRRAIIGAACARIRPIGRLSLLHGARLRAAAAISLATRALR